MARELELREAEAAIEKHGFLDRVCQAVQEVGNGFAGIIKGDFGGGKLR